MTKLLINRRFPMMSHISAFEEAMEEFFNKPAAIVGREKSSYPMNITKTIKDGNVISYNLTYALAGFAKDEIKITVKDDVLKIEVEKKLYEAEEGIVFETIYNGISYKDMSMSFKLLNGVDKENITSKYENGLLVITVPAKKEEDNCININIE